MFIVTEQNTRAQTIHTTSFSNSKRQLHVELPYLYLLCLEAKMDFLFYLLWVLLVSINFRFARLSDDSVCSLSLSEHNRRHPHPLPIISIMPPSNSSTRSNQEFFFPLPIFASDGPQLDTAASRHEGPDFHDLFASASQPSGGPGILTPGADRTTFTKQPSTSTPTVYPGRDNSSLFPPRSSALRSHTPEDVFPQGFDETFLGENPDFGYPHYPIPLDEHGNPHPMLLASLNLQPLEQPQPRAKTPYNGLATPPNSASPGGQWGGRGPTSPVSPTASRSDDKWHVVTLSQTHASEYKPPSRRREAFQQHTVSTKSTGMVPVCR